MQDASVDNSIWTQLLEVISTPSLQLGLLIGSAVLAISLLVLMLTRWGQSRPVLKCVVLSIVAHVLLLGWAYGTRLILRVPTMAKVDAVQVSVVDELDAPDDAAEQKPSRPWEDRPRLDEVPEIVETTPTLESTAAAFEPTLAKIETGAADNVPVPVEATWDSLAAAAAPKVQDFADSARELAIAEVPPALSEPLASVDPTVRMPDVAIPPPESPREHGNVDSSPAAEHAQVPDVPEMTETPRADVAADHGNGVPDLPTFDSESPLPSVPPTERGWSASVPDHEPDGAIAPAPHWQTTNVPAIPVSRTKADGATAGSAPEPRRLGDGQPIPSLYTPRMTRDLDEIALQRGGSRETQAAVELALKWLAATQQDDGRWEPRLTGAGREQKVLGHDRRGAGAEADTGITALATLAFMGAGNTHLEGPYRKNVQRALEFLVRSQSRDGCLAGDAQLFARMYCHSMALLALSEALAVTGDVRLHDPVRRGVEYTTRSQSAIDGGWRYQPGDRGDMSQFGWQVMALHSASIGGVAIPESTVEGMHRFLDSCCSGQFGGLASYKPGEGVSTTMTAEALLCRYFMKKEIPEPLRKEAEARLMREMPGSSRENLYYWYYATMALYHGGGEAWEAWNRQLVPALLERQIVTGNQTGSWAPNGVWAGYGGRVYSTAMATLCLEVYYRYLPVWELRQESGVDRMADEAAPRRR